MRAPLSLVLAASLVACGVDTGAPREARPPARRPAPPRSECAVGGPARSFPGRAPALAEDAVVVHDAAGGATLYRLDAPSEPPRALAAPVLDLAREGAGWIAVHADRLARLDEAGAVAWELPLEGAPARDAALALDVNRAWVVLRDADDEIRLHAVDLATREAGAAAPVGRGRGRLLVAPRRAAWAAPDARLTAVDVEAAEIPGAPVALVGAHVLYVARDRTGVWVAGAPPVRATRGDLVADAPLAAAIGERIALAYSSGGDLFVQAASASEGALGEPVLVAPSAVASRLAVAGERFWLAWERGEDVVEVRAGECRGATSD